MDVKELKEALEYRNKNVFDSISEDELLAAGVDGIDLIVSGHAHGGQWRIPGLINGLYAPHQGVFPQYAGGRYDLDGSVLLVSRGLARESTRIPRLFNRPELMLAEIVPSAGAK